MFFSHNYAKIQINSYDSFPLVKTSTLCNVIILIKSFQLNHFNESPIKIIKIAFYFILKAISLFNIIKLFF